jgi:ankyrin repeat protein
MLDSKMDIEAKNGAGWTALFYAVDQNKKEYARELILRGANIDVTDLPTGLGILEYPCNEETKKVVIEAIRERDLKKNINGGILGLKKYSLR